MQQLGEIEVRNERLAQLVNQVQFTQIAPRTTEHRELISLTANRLC